jgi:predicted permease
VVLTLGAGFALGLTVLAVVNAYMIRALPYPAADRLYSVILNRPGSPPIRGLENIDWSAVDGVVEQRIAWDLDMFHLLGGSYPEAAPGAWVTPGFVQGLGLRAEIGRVLGADDFTPGGPTPVMISRGLWSTRFGRDPNIVGRSMRAYVSDRPDEAETLTIVGVLADFWHENIFTDVLGPLRAPSFPYLVRLRQGVDAESVADRITALVRTSAAGVPAEWHATIASMQEGYVEEMRPVLKAVALSAALVLLIACANVAVLLLVRSVRRRHEIAIRLALGASRTRLARLLGLEALLLGSGATGVGMAMSALLTRGIAPIVEQRLGRRLPGGESALALDGTLLAVSMAAGIFLTLVLMTAPLLTLWSTVATPALKTGGRWSTEGRAARRLRSALIAAEIGAALALLVGSALLIRSSVAMLSADPGFRATGLLATHVGLRALAYPDPTSRARFFQRLLQRFDQHNTGDRVALSSARPLRQVQSRRVEREGQRNGAVQAGVTHVTSQYFATLGIPFLDGTAFGANDRLGGEPVVIISESLARRLWPDVRAVGQELRIAAAGTATETASSAVAHVVVGVVGDVKQIEYDDGRVHADSNVLDAYVPLLREPSRSAFLYIRGFSQAPGAVRTDIASLDSEVSVQAPENVAEMLAKSRSGPKELAWVLSSFAGFAALLALIGVYSVIAYSVRQREREIGVRLVVGAEPRAVTRLFVRQGSPLIVGGLLAGLLAAAALGHVLSNQLFGVEPMAPSVLAATTALFAMCGWLALWWPARRAASIDPAQVLKDE